MTLCTTLHWAQHRGYAATPILLPLKTIPHDESRIWYVGCAISKCADLVFWCTCYRVLPLLICWTTWGNILGWMRSYGCRLWVRKTESKAIWIGPAWWRSARGSCHVCAERWPKPMVGSLGDLVGCMPLNLASKGRRWWDPVGGAIFVYIKQRG